MCLSELKTLLTFLVNLSNHSVKGPGHGHNLLPSLNVSNDLLMHINLPFHFREPYILITRHFVQGCHPPSSRFVSFLSYRPQMSENVIKALTCPLSNVKVVGETTSACKYVHYTPIFSACVHTCFPPLHSLILSPSLFTRAS